MVRIHFFRETKATWLKFTIALSLKCFICWVFRAWPSRQIPLLRDCGRKNAQDLLRVCNDVTIINIVEIHFYYWGENIFSAQHDLSYMTGHMTAYVKFGVTSMHKKCFRGTFAIYLEIVEKQQSERKKKTFFALPFRQVVKTHKNRLLWYTMKGAKPPPPVSSLPKLNIVWNKTLLRRHRWERKSKE